MFCRVDIIELQSRAETNESPPPDRGRGARRTNGVPKFERSYTDIAADNFYDPNGPISRSGSIYTSYGSGISGGGSAPLGGSVYRGNTYSLDPSATGSHTASSANSLGGSSDEALVGDQHVKDNDDSATDIVDAQVDYQYYPSAVYDNMPSQPVPDRSRIVGKSPLHRGY